MSNGFVLWVNAREPRARMNLNWILVIPCFSITFLNWKVIFDVPIQGAYRFRETPPPHPACGVDKCHEHQTNMSRVCVPHRASVNRRRRKWARRKWVARENAALFQTSTTTRHGLWQRFSSCFNRNSDMRNMREASERNHLPIKISRGGEQQFPGIGISSDFFF